MIEMRKYHHSDLERIKVQAEQAAEIDKIYVAEKTAFSLWDGDKILGVFWTICPNSGRLTAQSVISADCGDKMLEIVRTLKKMIEGGAVKMGLYRIEIIVVYGFRNGERLARLLGFEYEGTLRKLINGVDYKIFARIF